jgi:hypothetical protein
MFTSDWELYAGARWRSIHSLGYNTYWLIYSCVNITQAGVHQGEIQHALTEKITRAEPFIIMFDLGRHA